jgi:uncharacterized protein YndB with AHSA1/START domain
MSVKKEPSGRRSVQVEVEVPGTPEEVWQAISTGPGISSWFVPTVMDNHAGGKISCHFGPGMDSNGTITSWEPPVRFAAEEKWAGENGPVFATEWFVEARSGGMCVVRVVHSLFADSDDWDNQLEGTETGWPVFFRVLRLYMSHFRGMNGQSMIAMGVSPDREHQTWNKLIESLGLNNAMVGQKTKTGPNAPQLSGTVEWMNENQKAPSLLLKLEEPGPGIALLSASDCGGTVQVSASVYLYGDSAETLVPKQQSAWQAWMNEQFPAPVSSARE